MVGQTSVQSVRKAISQSASQAVSQIYCQYVSQEIIHTGIQSISKYESELVEERVDQPGE